MHLPTPPWSGVGRRMESAIRKSLYELALDPAERRLGVALSGGKDSLTLLAMLAAISGRGFPRWELYAFHVAGAFSCGPSVMTPSLRSYCDSVGAHLIVRETKQTLSQLECYSCSRMRRKLLFAAAKEHGVHTLAFGHHRDDNVQTLLLNLLHKGSFEGMATKIHMKKYGVTIVRPLVYVSEAMIRSFSSQHGFARILCRCPVGQKSKRRRVEALLQALEREFPNARENLNYAVVEHGRDSFDK